MCDDPRNQFRRVRQWVARLIEMGLLEREHLSLQEDSIVWVARRGRQVDFAEVELTAKTPARYRLIFGSHTFRLRQSELTRVVYLCTREVARTVRREAARWIPPQSLPRLVALDAIDVRGGIATGPSRLWNGAPVPE